MGIVSDGPALPAVALRGDAVTTLTSINEAFCLHAKVCKLCGNFSSAAVCAIGLKLLAHFHQAILEDIRREALGLGSPKRKPGAHLLTM